MSLPELSRTHRPPRAASAWLHAALALALVLAQAVGLLHRTAHAPHDMGQPTHASTPHAVEAHATEDRFGHAPEQAEQCRLFDQLVLADLLVGAAPALPVFDAPCRAIDATGTARAQAVSTAYRARAPPAFG